MKPLANIARMRVEIEQRLHQRGIVGDRVDDLDGHVARLLRADAAEVDVGRVLDQIAVEHLGPREHRIGDLLRRRAAIADIVLDAEIAVRPAGIVAGRRGSRPPNALWWRMTWLAAGVESRPPCPTSTLPKPLAEAMRDDRLDGDGR